MTHDEQQRILTPATSSTDPVSVDEFDTQTVLLFPGQGAYDDAALLAARPALTSVREVFEQIDAVAALLQPDAAHVTDTVFAPAPPALESLSSQSPDLLQLTLFGISVAVYRALEAETVPPGALVGHSLGEIAALVCGGAFSIEQGAEIICHRNSTLRAVADRPGAMGALGSSADRARALLTLLDQTDVVVAAENSPGQSVVSGTEEGLAAVQKVARAVPITFVRLQSPYAFHSPLLAPLVDTLAARLRHLTPGPLTTPVYSPIVGRWYQDGDAFADLLASHLLRPVRFVDAVRQLGAGGGRVFVECGARGALTSLVGQTLPGATTVTCLDGQHASRFPGEQAAVLRGPARRTEVLDDELVGLLLPGVEPAWARKFWATHGGEVLVEIRRRYAAYHEEQAPADALAVEVPAPAAPRTTEPVADHPGGTREELVAELTAFYADALEYPPEVFTEDVELEADLGVDSVKQTELIARVATKYGLPERPEGFRLSDYPTLGRVADFVWSASTSRELAA